MRLPSRCGAPTEPNSSPVCCCGFFGASLVWLSLRMAKSPSPHQRVTPRAGPPFVGCSARFGHAGAQLGLVVELAAFPDPFAELVALLVDRGDHRAHRHA